MAHTDKISELVQTVRILNWEIRPKVANSTGGSQDNAALHEALAAIRNNEIETSQLIRSMSLSESTVDTDEVGRVVEHVDSSTIGPRQLLSEFGTAREAILSILRNLTDEEWEAKHETRNGAFSYEEVIDRLIESDRTHVGRIQSSVS